MARVMRFKVSIGSENKEATLVIRTSGMPDGKTDEQALADHIALISLLSNEEFFALASSEGGAEVIGSVSVEGIDDEDLLERWDDVQPLY